MTNIHPSTTPHGKLSITLRFRDRVRQTAFATLVLAGITSMCLAGDDKSADSQFQEAILLLDKSASGEAGAKAISLLEKAAETNHPEALNRLGYCYGAGIVVKANPGIARDYFRKASESGLSKAKFNYGKYLLSGEGGPADAKKGLELLSEASKDGVAQAKQQLARTYYFGDFGVEKNYPTALELFLQLAESGDADAQNFVGTMYSYGMGTTLNREEGALWWERAATQGHAKAQASFGDRLLYGTGVKKDVPRGLMFLMLSAAQNEATGVNALDITMTRVDPETISLATTMVDEFQQRSASKGKE